MGSQKPLSYKTPNMRRAEKNTATAAKLKAAGYEVHTDKRYPNNAYWAIEAEANHLPHEIETVKILAENGISTTLRKEGSVFVNGGALPTFDGVSHSMSFEIRQTVAGSSKNLASKIAEAIAHSRKSSKITNYIIQADVAVSYTKNPRVHEATVVAGIDSHAKRAPHNQGRPRFLLQVDGGARKVYIYKIEGGR